MSGTRLMACCIALAVAPHATAQHAPRSPGGRVVDDPQRLISTTSLLEVVGELAAIRRFDGFRTATTDGEREAFAAITARLGAMPHLSALGLEIEWQSARTPFGLVPREDRLWMTVVGATHEVPASVPAGFSAAFSLARWFDSDGVVGDRAPDPVAVTAEPILVATAREMITLPADRVAGAALVLRHEAVDCLTSPAAGLPRVVGIEGTPPAVAADDDLPWPTYLGSAARRRGVRPVVAAAGFGSDNVAFQGFDVPNAEMIAWDPTVDASPIPHGQIHVPYDDLPLAEREIDLLVDMTRVALAAALDVGRELPSLRITPPPDRRAVMVASHCELPHLTPAGLTELGMTLAAEGFDVDVVAYGEPVAPATLDGADLVVVLPAYDAPDPAAGAALPDETWRDAELDALEAYVAGGGLLVVTHARGIMMGLNARVAGIVNEDSASDGVLAARFGFGFDDDAPELDGFVYTAEGDHPLVAGVGTAVGGLGTGVPVVHAGTTLLSHEGTPVAAAIAVGDAGGEVVALGDLGLLADNYLTGVQNVRLWRNLAARARDGVRVGAD